MGMSTEVLYGKKCGLFADRDYPNRDNPKGRGGAVGEVRGEAGEGSVGVGGGMGREEYQ